MYDRSICGIETCVIRICTWLTHRQTCAISFGLCLLLFLWMVTLWFPLALGLFNVWLWVKTLVLYPSEHLRNEQNRFCWDVHLPLSGWFILTHSHLAMGPLYPECSVGPSHLWMVVTPTSPRMI